MPARELRPSDMTPDQREVYGLFCDLVYGEHHILGKIRECGRGLLWNAQCTRLSTFDFDDLTRLVLMAHDRCIRVEIVPSGPGMVGIMGHKRHTREGDSYSRHPTIEQAIERFNARRAA